LFARTWLTTYSILALRANNGQDLKHTGQFDVMINSLPIIKGTSHLSSINYMIDYIPKLNSTNLHHSIFRS